MFPVEPSLLPAPRIIFLHIPKTAGMSLNGLFLRNYRGSDRLNTELRDFTRVEWDKCLQRIHSTPRHELDRCGVFKGHMIYGLHEALPWPVEYITFLREPVQRFVSHFKMVRRLGGFPADHAIDPSKSDWNLGSAPAFLRTLDNLQTRCLAGADIELPFGACTEEHLRLAKANLERHFKFVGLTDQFDLSLMLMTHLCGWGWHFYIPDNVAPDTSAPVPPLVIEEIRRLNQFDREIYRHAQERFAREVARHGIRLQLEWALYRAGNRLHRELHHWRHLIKRQLGMERRPAMTTG